ncbi:SgcJ/EcaC family oxidoreductase [Derxia lacustris]|uniref:SgcJ/EcaC family oxidoreductase n=1 Tax=Derxia lacustris TaxID=764842 RepID=UPI000A16D7B6|nr:SgcJ/EcaC family oxidoreductase [Derxia lacustris]
MRISTPSFRCGGALALAAALALAGCKTLPAMSGSAPTGPAAAMQAWVDAFNACDPAALAALYEQDAALWGTVAPQLIESPAGIRAYYERACAGEVKPKVAIAEESLRVYGDTAIDTGSYAFALPRDGQMRVVPARFSLVFQRFGERWLIVDHHSSLLPPAPAGAPPR